jgi:hypothetical protein
MSPTPLRQQGRWRGTTEPGHESHPNGKPLRFVRPFLLNLQRICAAFSPGSFGGSRTLSVERIRKLERELARKEKALAEAATLLVLKKTIECHFQHEDDDTDGQNER